MANKRIIMSESFINDLDIVKNILTTKQEEMDKLFNKFIKNNNITNEDVRDALFDYCYNDFMSPILENFLSEQNNDE